MTNLDGYLGSPRLQMPAWARVVLTRTGGTFGGMKPTAVTKAFAGARFKPKLRLCVTITTSVNR
jgi:hypothetical protein